MIRAVLVTMCVVAVALALVGMRRGWRNRAHRQSWMPAVPGPPVHPGPELARLDGLYVGSCLASSWQDRVVHGGLGQRAAGVARWHSVGLVIERRGADTVFIPAANVRHARLAAGLAGKVTGSGGLLVVQWQLGEAVVDTGFRADDKTRYPDWVRMINGKVTAS